MSVHYKQEELDREADLHAQGLVVMRTADDLLVERRKGAEAAYKRGNEAVKCVEEHPAHMVKLTQTH